ncbi:MAG: IMPACT family protein [Clostridiales bacterium]|nr:IMPACT family protein [Clostridiales bacterium]
MKMVYRDGHGELEVKRSRFIADLHPASSEDEARKYIADIRKKYSDARHHCYAFVCGPDGGIAKSSDDGEPSGTAGRPILELLNKEGIHDAVLVVTRYFGGTLLGTGGLVRAYQSTAKAAVGDSVLIEKRAGRRLIIVTGYGCLGKMQALCAAESFPVTDTRYTDMAEMEIIVPADEVGFVIEKTADATAGGAKVYVGDMTWYALADGQVVIFDKY